MKKILLISALFIYLHSFSQNESWRSNIGLTSGFTAYNGDLGNDIARMRYASPILGLNFNQYLNHHFDIGAQFLFTQWTMDDAVQGGFSSDVTLLHLESRWKPWGYTCPHVTPYVFLGIGGQYFSSYTFKKAYESDVSSNPDLEKIRWAIPFGVGLQFTILDRYTLGVRESILFAGTDAMDAMDRGNNGDQMFMHQITFGVNLNHKKDDDHDGVQDAVDACLNTPAGVAVDSHGCPVDSDGDGFPDYSDMCPTVYGQASGSGCPDQDGDAIPDNLDGCPNQFGTLDHDGCADHDEDGIIDDEDKCPFDFGSTKSRGCPDRDNDGVIDSEDYCPNDKGNADLKGCPDKDKDGVKDLDDKCPDVPGIPSLNGCPEIKKEVLDVMTKALQGVQFETGKDILKPSSYAILDDVVKAMKENPTYKLEINGHTDNQGDSAKNLDLSMRRANAVLIYLSEHGVPSTRMFARGYGDTKPKADNNSKEGRAANRRVEFIVIF